MKTRLFVFLLVALAVLAASIAQGTVIWGSGP
jgi:hypothetical protein